jgi:hypothetical protein
MLATERLVEQPLWVMGCRSDYVGSTSGVPDIADELIAPRKWAALGHERTFRTWLAVRARPIDDIGGIIKGTIP